MTVSLRKFPYPYRAVLAISSDLDNTPSLDVYLAMMDYLNTTGETPFGPGLGLEVGNSCWFYNGTSSPQLSYFSDDGHTPTPFAGHCRRFWRSGHMDTLHTYGDFDEGGFQRGHAEAAVAELARHGVRLPVWINHGTRRNLQNVGPYPCFEGDNPNHPAWHMDLTRSAGLRYYWIGRMTHVLGQDAENTWSVRTKNALQMIMAKTKYRSLKESPLFDLRNRLLLPAEFQDGSRTWEFQRWVNVRGEVQTLDSRDLAIQLRAANLRTLVRNQGFLVLYTHFCENLDLDAGLLPELKANLEYLQRLFLEGMLLVTTTSRLLRYREVSAHLEYLTRMEDGAVSIEIHDQLKTPVGKEAIEEHDLQGLTFYVNHPEQGRVGFRNQPIPFDANPPDRTGKRSISIPWKPLEYPCG